MGASIATKNAMLEVVRTKALFFGLVNGNPDTSGVEVSAASYARQAISFLPAIGGTMENVSQVDFPQALEDWGNITHWCLFSGSGGSADIVWTGEFDVARQILMGDIMFIQPGGVSLEIRECQG